MASSTQNSPKTIDTSSLPPEGVRTAITFGLIVYLFLLAVGWLTSSSMGTSPMCERLHDTLLQPLNAALLTERYEFNGVNDARFQVGAVIRATPLNKDGSALPSVYYPLPDKLSDRHQQYLQQLINGAASFASNREDTLADKVMTVVGGEILRDTGAAQVKLRCYLPANEYETAEALFKQTPPERVSDKNIREDGLANYETLFSAIVTSLSNQPIQYARDSGTALSAPAAKMAPKPKTSSSTSEFNSKTPSKSSATPADEKSNSSDNDK